MHYPYMSIVEDHSCFLCVAMSSGDTTFIGVGSDEPTQP